MIYATKNAAGFATCFFDDRINDIPADAFEITPEVHAICMAKQSRVRWEGGNLIDAPPPEPKASEAEPLASAADLQQQLDTLHGKAALLQEQITALHTKPE